MIALIPHHLPRLIGFNAASRVDAHEFSQQGAYLAGLATAQGVQRSLTKGIGHVSRGMDRLAAQRQQRLTGPASGDGEGDGSMDTTLRAATDTGNTEEEGS